MKFFVRLKSYIFTNLLDFKGFYTANGKARQEVISNWDTTMVLRVKLSHVGVTRKENPLFKHVNVIYIF